MAGTVKPWEEPARVQTPSAQNGKVPGEGRV